MTDPNTPDGLATRRKQLLEAMSAVSEDRTCTGWASDWARTLHAEGGIWETIGREVGWPTGNYDAWVWVSWDEAASLYGHVKAGEVADAVLAVLPPPADQAVLREAADDLAEFIALHGPTSRTVAGWRGAVGFLRRMADEAQQPPATETPCERCGHGRQAHNIGGCTACLEGWRADHRFMSVDEPPADRWSVEYHRPGPARLNPAVCTCGLGPDAIVHNEPPHAFNGRPKPGMPPVYGVCADCHHHETAFCHTVAEEG